jgi:hypothetical protein
MPLDMLGYLTHNPYSQGSTLVSGDILSAPGGSRNVFYALESTLVHPSHTDGFVDRLDAVTLGSVAKIPGLALAGAAAATDYVPILLAFDPVVIAMSCKGETAGGSGAIAIGDLVYADTDLEINLDSTNGSIFGLAMGAVSSGATTIIPVLLLRN